MQYNHNRYNADTNSLVFFVDMNSYFATCEQQVNYYLRGRPVGVCVYTGKFGCIIAPSVEAKKMGVKTGMRLNDAMKICPELVPLETHPARYREFHVKIINVLKKYCNEVIPRSIDEAVMDLTSYRKIYPNPIELAKKIKADIKNEVGDWMRCSIGIAPNAFLAKLATDLQKPDGLVTIMPGIIETATN
jgi:DNA polymerase IV